MKNSKDTKTRNARRRTSRSSPKQAKRRYTKCPECGDELQATVPFYISQVQVDVDGFITRYTQAYDNTKDCINLDEPELTQIYCANDHPFILPTSKRAKASAQPKERTKQVRKR